MMYFAYGIDLDASTLMEWTRDNSLPVPARTLVGPASLDNHRLAFPIYSEAWQGGVADVAPQAGKSVAGVLFDVSERTLKLLDGFFGPKYRRVKIVATLYRGHMPVEAVTYQSTVHDVRPFPPSELYIDRLAAGAYAFGLSALWIMQVQSFARNQPAISGVSLRWEQAPDLGDLVFAPPAA